MSERDIQVAYIDREIESGNEEYRGRKVSFLMCHSLEIMQELASIDADEINLDYVNSEFVQKWQEKSYDAAIESIDWSALNQCKHCHKYYDPAEVWYGTGDDFDGDIFCSGDCAASYKQYVESGGEKADLAVHINY